MSASHPEAVGPSQEVGALPRAKAAAAGAHDRTAPGEFSPAEIPPEPGVAAPTLADALSRLAAWIASARERGRRTAVTRSRFRPPAAFERWVEQQRRAPAVHAQLEAIAARLRNRVTAADHTLSLVSLSGEADMALVALSLAATFGQYGYRTLVAELDDQLQTLSLVVGDDGRAMGTPAAGHAGMAPVPAIQLHAPNVWFAPVSVRGEGPARSIQEWLPAEFAAAFDLTIATLGVWNSLTGIPSPPVLAGRVVAVVRIGVTTRTDYQRFVRHAKNRAWHLEGCIVLGDRYSETR